MDQQAVASDTNSTEGGRPAPSGQGGCGPCRAMGVEFQAARGLGFRVLAWAILGLIGLCVLIGVIGIITTAWRYVRG